MTTKRQKQAVLFCEEWLDITFNGDINNFKQVSSFLSEHLNHAKYVYNENYRLYSDEGQYRQFCQEYLYKD